MNTKTMVLAASLVLSLSGAAWAQTRAGGGSAEGNVNNPGSVKSNSEKANEAVTGSATGPAGDARIVPGTGTSGSSVGPDAGTSTVGGAPAR
jgi:hypothetical protein